MKRIGQGLLALGALVGGAVGVAVLGHLGIAGAPWLLNVAVAKLGLVASAGLMAAGAMTLRLSKRREQAKLGAGESPR
ncbi:MAG: hypothetical protein ACREPM_05115 [Gemmatimonadaceae bacterium]